MSDLPSQYTEDIETLRQIPISPTPGTAFLGPPPQSGLRPVLKETFDKFKQDLQDTSLLAGKYIKPPTSTATKVN